MEEDTIPTEGGQESTTPTVPSPQGQAVSSEPFFSVKDESGKDVHFKSKDELAQAWKTSGMLRSDYTRKTQAHGEERKKFESEREEHQRWYQDQQQRVREYEQLDKFLKSRPDVFQYAKKMMQKGVAPDTMMEMVQKQFDEKYGKELNELKGWRQEQEAQANRTKIMAAMREKYEDFDEEAVSTALAELAQGDLSSLMETLYHSLKGRTNPLQIEKRVVDNLERKKTARMMPGSGATSNTKKGFKSLSEAKTTALMGS
jgi:hypothetical protein